MDLTLTGLEPALGFVDHIYTALAAHHAAVTVAAFQRPERIFDLHGPSPYLWAAEEPGEFLVGTTGVEPVTPTMST